jgi:histone H3
LTPPVAGADLRAALVASCLRGALPPVDLRAVCLVRAILIYFIVNFFIIN